MPLSTIRERLGAFGPPLPSDVEGRVIRASAVLAPLYEEEGRVWVVLTRRAGHLRAHRGEVSFPGGGQEPGEELVDTAFREAWEEVRLPREGVEVIGELDHLTTVSSNSYIVPLVGALPGRPDLTPDPAEVEKILNVPLDELTADGVYREERWMRAPPRARTIYFFELVGDTVWGATARMLRQLLCIALSLEARPDDT